MTRDLGVTLIGSIIGTNDVTIDVLTVIRHIGPSRIAGVQVEEGIAANETSGRNH
jgi:hypothetical protein